MTRFHRGGTLLLSALTVALGLALIGRGIAGGAPVAALLGVLFVAAGAGRIFLLRRR